MFPFLCSNIAQRIPVGTLDADDTPNLAQNAAPRAHSSIRHAPASLDVHLSSCAGGERDANKPLGVSQHAAFSHGRDTYSTQHWQLEQHGMAPT